MLDLSDIAFTGAGEATFAGDASGGLLTVGDGTNTASIRLIGDYLSDSFVAASDGAGGVAITAAASAAPSAHPLVAAMAGLGAAVAASPVGAGTYLQHRPMLLAGCSRA